MGREGQGRTVEDNTLRHVVQKKVKETEYDGRAKKKEAS